MLEAYRINQLILKSYMECIAHYAFHDVDYLFSWCREGGSNPHEVALGGF